jgi:hypothetical protein
VQNIFEGELTTDLWLLRHRQTVARFCVPLAIETGTIIPEICITEHKRLSYSAITQPRFGVPSVENIWQPLVPQITLLYMTALQGHSRIQFHWMRMLRNGLCGESRNCSTDWAQMPLTAVYSFHLWVPSYLLRWPLSLPTLVVFNLFCSRIPRCNFSSFYAPKVVSVQFKLYRVCIPRQNKLDKLHLGPIIQYLSRNNMSVFNSI